MDAMAVAIHIKYALSLNPHITFYSRVTWTKTDFGTSIGKKYASTVDPVPQLNGSAYQNPKFVRPTHVNKL